jgi:hypothetical protein
MKNIIKIITFFIGLTCCGVAMSQSQVYVNGYYNQYGTYVAPHYRTAPNKTINDNWSTKPNYNPYTGKQGTVKPSNSYYNNSYYRQPTYYQPTYYNNSYYYNPY